MKTSLVVRTAAILGSTAGIVCLATGVSFASSGPVFSPGETVDVFTLPYYGTTGFTISLFPESGTGNFNNTVPLTYVGQITGNFTPDFATQDGINWGTTWDEFSFKMPPGGTTGHTYGALINTGSGGAVFTRFEGYPDPTEPYGTTFTYQTPTTPPTGQLPEVPYSAALPLVAGGIVWASLRLGRRQATTG
ncbi:hypothetical protein TPY_0085 [Sulfobacillus acidophilus TPY]|uniref:Uncharacterized protein n=1 Tax=Sulfobacillus acidophilus (strain ATCC 700253 / DSM 10332 / NAL) TaxID=679936 RepID=G8TVL0_SULAD|nr:hypothetical protein TPY_0085 [Sulfobacillus acidophilus TPY]AEW03649.1 hypothetical protein Sulac_0076 [Sulfobacillus acidophilus DSM 10332]